MVKQSLVVLGVCSAMGAVVGCGSETTGGDGTANQNPVITDLAAEQDAVVMTIGTTTISVQANDPDGDPLTYSWTVNVGALDALDGAEPKLLTAPGERGTVTVTVTVADGKGGTAEQSLDIGVLGWAVPGSASAIPEGLDFNAMGFANADDGIIAGGSETNNVPYIFHYRSGTWADETKGSAGHMTAAAVIAPDNMWVAGGGGVAFHFDGTEWTQFTIPGGCVHGMAALDANNIWVTPAEAQETMRQYTGGNLNAWTSFDAPEAIGMNGVSMAAADHGWAVGSGGRVHHFDGTAWARVDIGTTRVLSSVAMISTTDGWLVGDSGTVYHWDGTTWTETASPAATRDVKGVFANATDDVWAVGEAGLMMHFDGAAWVELPSATDKTLTAVTFVSPTEGWATGLNSALLHLE